ncbi:MAG: hypothetical protein ACU0DI_05240 [Paracoccaceae bacterium]
MADDSSDHHLTATVLLPFERRAAAVKNRPPLPVAQVYPMNSLAIGKQRVTKTKSQPSASRRSMFFKGAQRDVKDDPFLQRLSRLN